MELITHTAGVQSLLLTSTAQRLSSTLLLWRAGINVVRFGFTRPVVFAIALGRLLVSWRQRSWGVYKAVHACGGRWICRPSTGWRRIGIGVGLIASQWLGEVKLSNGWEGRLRGV